jgi:3-phenylpropionate/cinnamic acid dioxygenase small subunit
MMARGKDPTANDIADFLHREADLLDRCDLAAWLDLFAGECVYWVPLSPDQTDPEASPSHVYDNRDTLEARVLRLLDPANLPQQEPSRCSRLLGHIRSVARTEIPNSADWGVRANFHLVECLPHHDADASQRIFAGTLTYGLVAEGGGLKIRSKRIDLLNSEKGLFGVSIIL